MFLPDRPSSGHLQNGRHTGHVAISDRASIRYKSVSLIMDKYIKYFYIKNPPTTLWWIAVILCHNLISKENKKRKKTIKIKRNWDILKRYTWLDTRDSRSGHHFLLYEKTRYCMAVTTGQQSDIKSFMN